MLETYRSSRGEKREKYHSIIILVSPFNRDILYNYSLLSFNTCSSIPLFPTFYSNYSYKFPLLNNISSIYFLAKKRIETLRNKTISFERKRSIKHLVFSVRRLPLSQQMIRKFSIDRERAIRSNACGEGLNHVRSHAR